MSVRARSTMSLQLEIEGAFVQSGGPNFLATNVRFEKALEHILLEPTDDRITFQHVQDRGMTFKNLRTTVLLLGGKLRHVAFPIPHLGKPFRTLGNGFTFDFGFQRGRLSFKHVIEKLLRSVWTVNFFGGFQQLERQLIAITWIKVVTATSKPINHFGTAHFLRAPPGIEITIALQRQAMLFNAHVAHLPFLDELVYGHPFGPLQ